MQNYRTGPLSIKHTGLLLPLLLTVVLSGCTPERIEISPQIDVNPPGTQHEITAKVTDAKGRPVYHTLVEWMLPRSENTVGDIVEGGDDPKRTSPIPKKTNTYAKTRTNFDGEAKITITSPAKGKTSIVAVAKGIEDQSEHKAYAIKYWDYLNWEFPVDAMNQAGTPHDMTVRIFKPISQQRPARFRITKRVLANLQTQLPIEIWEKLKTLESQQSAAKQAFIETLIDKIGARQTIEYRDLILRHAKTLARDDDLRNYRVEWEILANFNLTELVVETLRTKGVPGDVLDKLNAIKNREVIGKREFLELVAKQIGKGPMRTYTPLLSQYAKVPIREEPEAYFEINGSELVQTDTSSKGLANITLRQVLPKDGHTRVRIRLMLPDKLPHGLDKVCCPKPNDVIAETIVKKTWKVPEIILTKSCQAKVALGAMTQFEFTLENRSNFDVTSVVVTDSIPPGFKYRGAISEPKTLIQHPEEGEVDGIATWAFQVLPSRARKTFKLDLEAAHVGIYENRVRASTPNTTELYVDSCLIEVVQPELKVWKFCPPMATVHEPFYYSYVVKNTGTTAVHNVTVEDILPQGVEVASGETPTWYLDTLSPGERQEGSFTVIPQASLFPGGSTYPGRCRVNEQWIQGKSLRNKIVAHGDWLLPGPKQMQTSDEECNTCVRPLPPPALLLEVVDLYDTVKIGDTTTYKITVTNQDRQTVKDINVTAWISDHYNDDDRLTPNPDDDEAIYPMASGPKVRVLKSIQDAAPNKQPLEAWPKDKLAYFPQKSLWQMLLAAHREAPQDLLWEFLYDKLTASVEPGQELLEEKLQGILANELIGMLKYIRGETADELIKSVRHATQRSTDIQPDIKLNRFSFSPADLHELLATNLKQIQQAMLPETKMRPITLTLSELEEIWVAIWQAVRQVALQAIPPLRPLVPSPNDRNLRKRWVTFDTVPQLKPYWRATYYVQVQAETDQDVRFKVVMSAEELSGAVIETESTHLVK